MVECTVKLSFQEYSGIFQVKYIFTISLIICIEIEDSILTYIFCLGLHEAVYHGVPMLCVPLFGDQPRNAQLLKVIHFASLLIHGYLNF